jgi:hypothetical protein
VQDEEKERAEGEKRKAIKNLPTVVKSMLGARARWLWWLLKKICSGDGQIVEGASEESMRRQQLTKQQSKAHSVMKDCLRCDSKGMAEELLKGKDGVEAKEAFLFGWKRPQG